MPRRRLGVALLLPPPWAHEVDGLRRACGDQQLDHTPAHCTLVPPINVRVGDVPAALTLVRTVAAQVRNPIDLALGPPASFHPDSPTLILPVDDRDGIVGALRNAVFTEPLRKKPPTRPFVPHVTLADEIDEDRARAAMEAFVDYRVSIPIDRLHLLEQVHDVGHGRLWAPIADAPFRPPAVVGRGGIEIELTVTTIVDPEAAELVSPCAVPLGASPLVVTARRHGAVVGVLTGWTRGEEHDVVERRVGEEHRGMGIGRHLLLAFEGYAADAAGVGG